MLIWCLFRWNLSRALLFFYGIRWSAQIGINGLGRLERDFKREENDSQKRNQVFNIFILSMKIKTGYFFSNFFIPSYWTLKRNCCGINNMHVPAVVHQSKRTEKAARHPTLETICINSELWTLWPSLCNELANVLRL